MVDQPSIEQVQELVQQLNPEERKLLAVFLASLKDSGFIVHEVLHYPMSPEQQETRRKALAEDTYYIVSTPYGGCVMLRELPLFEVQFFPENYSYLRKDKTAKQPPDSAVSKVVEELRAIHKLRGLTEPPEEKFIAVVTKILQHSHENRIEEIARAMSTLLGDLAFISFIGGEKIAEFVVDNQLAVLAGNPKKTVSELIERLKPLWKRIAKHLDVTPGGPQAIKYIWTPKDVLCLNTQNERLKPIWREAQKVATQAIKAKEPTRRKNWQEQVSAAYKDENLPADLIEELNPNLDPKLRTRPADLA